MVKNGEKKNKFDQNIQKNVKMFQTSGTSQTLKCFPVATAAIANLCRRHSTVVAAVAVAASAVAVRERKSPPQKWKKPDKK